jgi:hypothetical protein
VVEKNEDNYGLFLFKFHPSLFPPAEMGVSRNPVLGPSAVFWMPDQVRHDESADAFHV